MLVYWYINNRTLKGQSMELNLISYICSTALSLDISQESSPSFKDSRQSLNSISNGIQFCNKQKMASDFPYRV